jgi:large-conductance mechanosensitive channel
MEVILQMVIQACLGSLISKIISFLLISVIVFVTYCYFMNPALLQSSFNGLKGLLPFLGSK